MRFRRLYAIGHLAAVVAGCSAEVPLLDDDVTATQHEPGSNVLGMRVSQALEAARQWKETSL